MTTMTGMEKAALVIMQMSQQRAAEVMRQFTEVEAEEPASEIIRLRKVEEGHADAAITEFHARTRTGRADARGGHDAAALLLEASFGQERAAGLLDRAASAAGGPSFEFLESVEPAQLARVLDGELPETLALVLAHLDPEAASAILKTLDPGTRVDVAQAIAVMQVAHPEVLDVVAETIKARIRSAASPSEPSEVRGGVRPLVEIIGRADVALEYALLEELDRRDPRLADELRALMLGFDDILRLDDRGVQQVIRGIDAATLATALKGAEQEMVDVLRANMSERNRELLDDELSLLGKVKKSDIVEARAGLVRAIRDLHADGSISLRGEGDDESDEEAETDVA